MKKLFISQPMKDKTNEEIKSERDKIASRFYDYEIVESFFEDAPHDAKPLWFLGSSIKLMSDCDTVYFCKNWEKYNGCTIEHECAVRYGKEIIYA